jgi:uncharacterized protein
MPIMRVLNRTRGTVLGTRVRLADTLPARVRGYLFRPQPPMGDGILLTPCKAVHMFGVRFPLDVVFISEDGRVVATYRNLTPWRRSRVHGSALYALEVPAGTIQATDTAVGDVLFWASVDGAAAAEEAAERDEPQPEVGAKQAAAAVAPNEPVSGSATGPEATAVQEAPREQEPPEPAVPAARAGRRERRHA